MNTSEIREKVQIPGHRHCYLEHKGYINSEREKRGDLEARKYSQSDFNKAKTVLEISPTRIQTERGLSKGLGRAHTK